MGVWDWFFGEKEVLPSGGSSQMNAQKTDKAGLDLIKNFEGLRLRAYLPTPNDVPTIGYGSTSILGRKPILGESISLQQAEEQLEKDLYKFECTINKLVNVPLTQNQFDALVCFVYNVGSGAFTTSTMLKKLNAGDYVGASEQFIRWNKQAGKELPGLTRRRLAEKALFLS
jgi:lysozyme